MLDENKLSILAGLPQTTDNSQSKFTEELDPEDTIISNQKEEELEEAEPLEMQTELSFSSNPMSKIIFVFGGVTLIMFILWTLINNFNNRNLSHHVYTNTSDEVQPSVHSQLEPTDSEKGNLKTELALAEQKRQLEQLTLQNSTPLVEPIPPEPIETIPVREVQNTQPEPTVKSEPPPEPKIDPYQAQARVLKLGSFGSTSQQIEPLPQEINLKQEPTSNTSHRETSYLPPPPPTEILHSQVSQTELEAPLFRDENQQSRELIIPAGTITRAYLKEAITWSERTSLLEQQFVVELAESLKSSTGEIVAPANSLILVSVINYSSTGLVLLQPQALIVNGTHLPLIDSGLLIQAANGDYLLAERVSTGNNANNSGEIASELLGTAGDLGLLDRSLSSRLERTSRRFERNRYRRQHSSVTFWLLQENTELQLFFSRSLSIAPSSIQLRPKQLQPQSFELNPKVISSTTIPETITNTIYLAKTPKLRTSAPDHFFFPVSRNTTHLLPEQNYRNPENEDFCLNNSSLCNLLRI